MGGEYEILHYTEFLRTIPNRIQALSTNGSSVQGKLTYHDSCYLGRYNNIFDAPRELLDMVKTDRVELDRHQENSFCCGAGGGGMWIETDPNTRINQVRLRQALESKTDVLATACPYCLIMFEDAVRSKGVGDKIKILDIAEVLEKILLE
jgi:Fe-S oxidoreductase